ncbi:MAG: HTH domain-containing protein [Hyphomicrobiales bacterium]|jgi:predicted DNA-binding transcriptional regulator YafY
MRASRLLRILLILQNRGRQTSQQLAADLECTPRTILRDVDAMSEAGLPIVVFQGHGGGIELGFNYRTRLTGLTRQEAEAIALQLMLSNPAIDALGLNGTYQTARAKLLESLPDKTRAICEATEKRFILSAAASADPDPYVMALAQAVREKRIVTLQARSATPRQVHPRALAFDGQTWSLTDARYPKKPIAQVDWGDLNISARQFE